MAIWNPQHTSLPLISTLSVSLVLMSPATTDAVIFLLLHQPSS